MKTTIAVVVISMFGSGCGCEDKLIADAGVDPVGAVNNVDDLAKEATYCGLVDMKLCDTHCIPKDATCCRHYMEDGGPAPTTWYPEPNAPCY